jgi:polyhydroxyalkanoate synthase
VSALSLPAALMLSKCGLLKWKPSLQEEAASLLQRLDALPPPQLAEALGQAASQQLGELTAGITAYRASPVRRALKEPQTIWREGNSRLLDYGGDGPLALFVPSLINRAYILDLIEERSLMRWLAGHGVRPLLLDWGTPGETEAHFGLSDYTERLMGALTAQQTPVHLVGYCMGGLLALAAAHFNVKSLTLMATPWDFHAPNKAKAQQAAGLYKLWQPMTRELGYLPVEAIQTLFTMADPLSPQQKFRRFGVDPSDSIFPVLEDWINDGVPLTAQVADDCFINLYEKNNAHKIAAPQNITCPTLLVVPTTDRIVPPESARALAAYLTDCRVVNVPLGHVGMVISERAKQAVWPIILQSFLR